MAVKTMNRDSWRRVLERKIHTQAFAWGGLRGKISLLEIERLTAPLTIDYGTYQVKIVDEGYCWLQIAFDRQFFWVTAMFDENGRLAEVYVDMTDGNVVDVENPYFEDMYLDYVLTGGRVLELDRDELDEALQSGAISRVQYERTLSEGAKVRSYLETHMQEAVDLICREYRRLKAQYGPGTDTGET